MNENERATRKVVVLMNVTLDGVIQAPGRPDEDLRGDFPYGGWAAPYAAMQSSEALQSLPPVGPLLLGRRTYEAMYDFWPKQANNPLTDQLNQMQKYVVSNTLPDPLPWVNSVLIQGNVAEAVAQLKAQPGENIMVMGSGELVQTLLEHCLVDLFVLLIHPIVLGTGRHLFPPGLPYAQLQLVDAKATSQGVVVATYQPAQSESQ